MRKFGSFKLAGGGLSASEKASLIAAVNAADLGNDAIKADVVTKLKAINPSLPITTSSTWTAIRTAITTVTDDANPITASKMALGKVAYVNGTKVTGTVIDYTGFPSQASSYVSPVSLRADTGGNLAIEPSPGLYASGKNASGYGTILVTDPNFIAANIKSGSSVFGLVGSAPPPILLEAKASRYTASGAATVKKVTMNVTATITISFDFSSSTGGVTANGQIFKNGVAAGTLRSNSTINVFTYSENFDCVPGDVFELRMSGSDRAVSNFIVRNAITSPTGGTVNTD